MTRLSNLRNGDLFTLIKPQRLYTRERSPETYRRYGTNISPAHLLVTDGLYVSRLHVDSEVTHALPEVKAGQVWEAGGARWFVDSDGDVLCSDADHDLRGRGSEVWIETYPDRKLILDA